MASDLDQTASATGELDHKTRLAVIQRASELDRQGHRREAAELLAALNAADRGAGGRALRQRAQG